MAKLLFSTLLITISLFFVACSSTPEPPKKKSLSTQPHNRPASWEGSGGMGAMMGQQYQD